MSRIIALVTNDLNQDQRMHRLCTTMHTLYDEVILVGREKPDSQTLLRMPFRQERLLLPYHSGPMFYAIANIRYLKYLFEIRPDVVYCVDYDTMLAGVWYKKFSNCKLIFDAHEYFTEVPELQDQSVKKEIWTYIARKCMPSFDLCITVNKSLAQIFFDKYNVPFHVIRNVPSLHVGDRSSNERIDKYGKIILYQGVLNQGRGLEAAIKTISKLPEYQLWLVGEGDLSDNLRKLSDEVNHFGNIHFLGWKSPEDLKAITNMAHVGLNLLETNSLNYKYSLANKYFDYMHAGIPSINMRFPEYEMLNQIDEVSVLIDDIEEYSIKKALEYLKIETIYQKLVSNAESARTKYNWDIESQKFMDCLQHISADR